MRLVRIKQALDKWCRFVSILTVWSSVNYWPGPRWLSIELLWPYRPYNCKVPRFVHKCYRFGCLFAFSCCSPQCGSSSSFVESQDKTPRWLPSWTSTTNFATEWRSRCGKLRRRRWSESWWRCSSFASTVGDWKFIYSMKLWQPSLVTEIFTIVLMLNSAVHPMAYAFYKAELRAELCYFILWLPDAVLRLTQLSPPQFLIDTYVLLVVLNSAVNPVAYAFYKREIRKELQKLFRCNRKQNLRNESGARGRRREIQQLRPFRNQ